MDTDFYLTQFQQAADRLDKKTLAQKSLQTAVGFYLKSVVLKLYKPTWANLPRPPLVEGARIFFSVWANEEALEEQKLWYNIHALYLRQLQGYSITSRHFAAAFREKFKGFENRWPNVGTLYGPQTLMQGWLPLEAETLQTDVLRLCDRFLETDHLIDELLATYKKAG